MTKDEVNKKINTKYLEILTIQNDFIRTTRFYNLMIVGDILLNNAEN